MKLLAIFLLFCGALFPQSLVFIHVGPNLPPYVATAICQARLFNKEWPIYLIASSTELQKLPSGLAFSPVPIEVLAQTESHRRFDKETKLSGFWKFATERFFYLEAFMQKYGQKNVFHLENDVMLYCDLSEMLPTFEKHYKGMVGAVFDNDFRCVPGFLFISDLTPMRAMTEHLAQLAAQSPNDMMAIGHFKGTYHRIFCDYLPIIMPNYDRPFQNALGWKAQDKSAFYNHFNEFRSIFDAAALGQYIGGNDPIHPGARPGFVNESSIFNAAILDYEWEKDAEGRFVPYVAYKGERCRVNNLHIHCKKLGAFYSLNRQMPVFVQSQ